MSQYDSIPRRRFYRSSSKAMVGGVCAGIADYFGFNLKVTRFLAVVALLFAFPATMLAYFATVLLVPSRPAPPQPDFDPEFRKALRSSPSRTMTETAAPPAQDR